MPTPDTPTPVPEPPPWRPVSPRQRLWLLALTVVTVLGLAYVLQRPHQRLVAAKATQQQAACQGEAASRPAGCPGARMPVLLMPPSPASAVAR